jgi:hypothetical protein
LKLPRFWVGRDGLKILLRAITSAAVDHQGRERPVVGRQFSFVSGELDVGGEADRGRYAYARSSKPAEAVA